MIKWGYFGIEVRWKEIRDYRGLTGLKYSGFFFFLCHLQCFVYNGDVFANWALVYLKKKKQFTKSLLCTQY